MKFGPAAAFAAAAHTAGRHPGPVRNSLRGSGCGGSRGRFPPRPRGRYSML